MSPAGHAGGDHGNTSHNGAPRVLLVDDDPLVRRFVSMVLEALDIELVLAASVDEAVAVLRAAPVRVLLTDLMLPGRSGLDLLQQLADEPPLRGAARVVVLSAGLTQPMQERLDAFDVWRRLIKPVSVTQLEACVREAVEQPDAPLRDAAGTPGSGADPQLDDAESAAVARHFAGDRGLFIAFRDSSLPQLALDMAAGRQALAAGDATTLRHLAHNLKSVLTMLGRADAAEIARTLEHELAAGASPDAGALWQRLHDVLG